MTIITGTRLCGGFEVTGDDGDDGDDVSVVVMIDGLRCACGERVGRQASLSGWGNARRKDKTPGRARTVILSVLAKDLPWTVEARSFANTLRMTMLFTSWVLPSALSLLREIRRHRQRRHVVPLGGILGLVQVAGLAAGVEGVFHVEAFQLLVQL